MLKSILSAFSLYLISSVSLSAHAALINHDIFFTDTDTDLDWLHLNNTVNISYNDVKGSMQSGGRFEGWRFATKNDLSILYNNAGSTFSRTQGQPHGGYAETGFNVLSPLWGLTYSTTTDTLTGHLRLSFMFDGAYTEVDSWVADYAWMGYINVNDDVSRSPSYPYDEYFYINYNEGSGHTLSRTNPNQYIGSALVRVSAVPIPAAAWLFGSGLIGMVAFARRRAYY